MKLPILCYHKVGPVAEEGRRLNIEPSRLTEHAAFFVRRGFRTVLAGDLAGEWPDRAVCFTFDDAYVSTLTHGVEAMQRAGALGSIYAVAGLVGRASSWDTGNQRPLADWDLLLQAQEAGFEIGNHTMTHARLGDLDRTGQTEEIAAASNALSERGLTQRSFCLPYGSHNPETPLALQSAGVTVGLALSRRPALPTDNRLLLPRIVVAYGDTLPKLLYKIHIRPVLPSFRKRPDYV
ncbi:MAG: polysaccharide deacetylase family protein [Fimbriimonadaceae bacterium]|nr:polysaccharide deacetylase family protein [Fimbriimonadaceae bacterium]